MSVPNPRKKESSIIVIFSAAGLDRWGGTASETLVPGFLIWYLNYLLIRPCLTTVNLAGDPKRRRAVIGPHVVVHAPLEQSREIVLLHEHIRPPLMLGYQVPHSPF